MKTFKVYIYNHHSHSRTSQVSCINNPLAYTTYYSPPRVCIHDIEAENGTKAKQLAIKEHKYSGKCNQEDSYCLHHPFCNLKERILIQ